MRSFLLALLFMLVAPLEADEGALARKVRAFASDEVEVRDAATRTVQRYVRREFAPLLQAANSDDPEVSRRARGILAEVLPQLKPTPTEAATAAWGQPMAVEGGVIIFVQELNGFISRVARDHKVAARAVLRFGLRGHRIVHPLLHAHLGLAEGRGFAVIAVQRGTAADQVGVRARDIVMAIDGKPVWTPDTVAAALGPQQHDWPDRRLKVMRRGKLVELTR
jgi:hypothetical protein